MMLSPHVSDSASHAAPLRSPLAMDPRRASVAQQGHHAMATSPQSRTHHAQLHHAPAGMALGGGTSLGPLQSLNPLGIGVGYALPMQMPAFRPLYMPTQDVSLGVEHSILGTPKAAKAGKTPVVGKRMKVSRACDECRRKKTRCDIESENEMCSLCRRANVMCTFARQQLKRGPARKRSSQPAPLPSAGSASPPALNPPAQRARSRSTSDSVRRGKESPVLPPIESLLSYQQAYSQVQAAPIAIPQQRAAGQAYSGHEPHVSPPISDYQQYSPHSQPLAPHQQHRYTPQRELHQQQQQQQLQQHQQQHQQQQQQQQQALGNQQQHAQSGLSGFPVLVEVACSQGKEAAEHHVGSVPASVSLAVPTKAVSPPSSVESASGIAGKAPTPPSYYDGGLHGVVHQALMEYYTFCHPIFPILPNSIAEFDAVFRDAGPLRQCLVEAINAAAADSAEPVNVPFGLGGSRIGGADREAHLMALLFVYMRTLEYTWLGAAVAEGVALNSEPLNPRTERLTALIAIFDRLHCVIFGTRSLFPADLHAVAMRYAPLAPTLTTLMTPATPPTSAEHFRTAPEIVLSTLGQLGTADALPNELLAKLETLAPQVQRTPLAKFVDAALQRRRSSEEMPLAAGAM